MKIELDIPFIEDDELSIKITIRKDGQVLVNHTSTPPVLEERTQPKKKKEKSSVKNTPLDSIGGNFMNAEF
jgi:hypothetical protein